MCQLRIILSWHLLVNSNFLSHLKFIFIFALFYWLFSICYIQCIWNWGFFLKYLSIGNRSIWRGLTIEQTRIWEITSKRRNVIWRFSSIIFRSRFQILRVKFLYAWFWLKLILLPINWIIRGWHIYCWNFVTIIVFRKF